MAADIATFGLAGQWWRQLPAGLDPTRRPDPAKDARWQRGDVAYAVYLAESPDTAWAEWYRWLAESGVPPRLGCLAICGGSRQRSRASSICAA